MQTIDVIINKPLYDNFVNINSSVVNKAIRLGLKMKVTIPKGTVIVDPVLWKKNGRVMKKVFLRPDEPMILYGNALQLPITSRGVVEGSKESRRRKIERQRKELQKSLF